jgi:hypothetical protein
VRRPTTWPQLRQMGSPEGCNFFRLAMSVAQVPSYRPHDVALASSWCAQRQPQRALCSHNQIKRGLRPPRVATEAGGPCGTGKEWIAFHENGMSLSLPSKSTASPAAYNRTTWGTSLIAAVLAPTPSLESGVWLNAMILKTLIAYLPPPSAGAWHDTHRFKIVAVTLMNGNLHATHGDVLAMVPLQHKHS